MIITKEEYDNFCSILNNPGYLGNFYRGSKAYMEIEIMKGKIREYEEALIQQQDQQNGIFSNEVSKSTGESTKKE